MKQITNRLRKLEAQIQHRPRPDEIRETKRINIVYVGNGPAVERKCRRTLDAMGYLFELVSMGENDELRIDEAALDRFVSSFPIELTDGSTGLVRPRSPCVRSEVACASLRRD